MNVRLHGCALKAKGVTIYTRAVALAIMRSCRVLAGTSEAAAWCLFVLRTCRLVITRPPAYVRNMSLAEIEEAVKGLNREELAKLASYMLALAHNA